MSNKIYRTALGKSVDMGALLLKNEDVRAVGNMGVNAKGDAINNKNNVRSSNVQQVNQIYRKQIRNQIVDVPLGVKEDTPNEKNDEIEGFDTPLNDVENTNTETETEIVIKTDTEDTPTKTKKGGLASAIAKAREVEQKKLQTPRDESRGKKGVKKI